MPVILSKKTYEKIMNDTFFDLPYGVIQIDKFLERKFDRLKRKQTIRKPFVARIVVESVPPEKVKYLPNATISYCHGAWEILVYPDQDIDIEEIAKKLDAIWYMTLDN